MCVRYEAGFNNITRGEPPPPLKKTTTKKTIDKKNPLKNICKKLETAASVLIQCVNDSVNVILVLISITWTAR